MKVLFLIFFCFSFAIAGLAQEKYKANPNAYFSTSLIFDGDKWGMNYADAKVLVIYSKTSGREGITICKMNMSSRKFLRLKAFLTDSTGITTRGVGMCDNLPCSFDLYFGPDGLDKKDMGLVLQFVEQFFKD